MEWNYTISNIYTTYQVNDVIYDSVIEITQNESAIEDVIQKINKVVTEVESVLVNVIKNTKVRGYEIFEQDVTLTKQNYYRAWIGLRLPLGEYNKMYNFTIEEAVDAYNLKEKANIAYNNLLKEEKSNDNSNIQ